MNVRLLTVLIVLAAAPCSWAPAPAAAWATDGGEAGTTASRSEPEEPEPIPDFWTEEEPAGEPPAAQQPPRDRGDAPSSSDQASTSPGGTAQGPGTTAGPGVPATTSQRQAEDAPACDPPATLRRALLSLRRAVRGHDLLAADPRPIAVRVSPCMPGTFELAIVVSGRETVLWRARRELRTTRRATLRLTMTPTGRRFVARMRRSGGGIVHMRLRARLYPAAR